MIELRRRPPFYNRAPWNLIIGFAFLFLIGINIAAMTTPWILLVPLVVWAIMSLQRHFRREFGLRDTGYYSHRQGRDHWIYEERQGYSVVALILPVAQTEPGHWEMFIPDDAKWRATVPEWALNRRKEIALRIAEGWKPKDFHVANDL